MEQNEIKLGKSGEQYGNWMSMPVFYWMGAGAAIAAILMILSFTLFKLPVLGVVFAVILVVLLIIICWFAWIRKQYSFTGGGIMEQVHKVVIKHLDFDGKGTILEVGCGSGALAIRCAKKWPEAQVTGLDYWGAVYQYSKEQCEKNAASEGVGDRCTFVRGDANKLEFPDETFDAVVSNYVYHNIMGSDKHELLKESLRVLKKGGVFALHDDMKPRMYGDMEAFAKELMDAGFSDVKYLSTAEEIFGTVKKANKVALGNSGVLYGRK